MRILIVEDEPVIARRVGNFCRKILGERLETLAVTGSFDATGARLASSPVDVVLLDLNLSGRAGMELFATCVAGSYSELVLIDVDGRVTFVQRGLDNPTSQPSARRPM